MKEPWQMTESEWNAAREACQPDNMQTNFTKASGSQAVAKFREMQRLCYGVRDEDSRRFKAAQDGKLNLSESELEDILWRLHTCVTWQEVVEKAKREGKL